MEYSNMKVRKDATTVPEGYDCRDCGGGDVCCDCCMKYGLHGHLPDEQPQQLSDFLTEAIGVLEMLLEALELDDGPFSEIELCDAIEENAVAVCYSERLLVWVPHHNLVDFMHPLLTEVLENEQFSILLDEGLALFDLTEICEKYGIDMDMVYELTEL